MTIEYSEQLEKFSFDSSISPQYIPYIVYGPDSLGDSVSEAEVQKIDQFLEKYEFVSFDENRLESPDFGRCSISGMQGEVVPAVFINKEAVKEEDQRRATQEKISGMSAENRETFEKVFQAHVNQKEFKEHPKLVESFRSKLADVFVDASRRGIQLKASEKEAPAKEINRER